MKQNIIFLFLLALAIASCGRRASNVEERQLAAQILQDTLMDKVSDMALNVIKSGVNAGDGYSEVWIRDYNSFIELAMDVLPDSLIQDNMLPFFRFQGETGEIVDGFTDIRLAKHNDGNCATCYTYRYSDLEPRYGAHKNTVETDQEASLVQAVWRYVTKSGNRAFLQQAIGGKTVLQRLEWALEYLLNERYDAKHGLIWGGTTADWGDVQPEHPWGVFLTDDSHLCLDIYDNAFFVIAINHYLELTDDAASRQRWTEVRDRVKANVRTHLWDSGKQKFIPHVYLDKSPFPDDFDEDAICYHGGTAMAIEADILTKDEIAASNAMMLANMKTTGAQSIGLTLYPPYPDGFFLNKTYMSPYEYQNGGDWTWFGARMIRQLARNGFIREAYTEVQPMLERVVKNKGFFEWYSIDGKPSGSGTYRGSAGVLYTAIEELKNWAEQHK
jgi:hypothetical protein